jgi:hypothetical protein
LIIKTRPAHNYFYTTNGTLFTSRGVVINDWRKFGEKLNTLQPTHAHKKNFDQRKDSISRRKKEKMRERKKEKERAGKKV